MRSIHCDHWPTTKSLGIPCYGRGKLSSCTIHPDQSACKCWRDGGAIHRKEGMANTRSAVRMQTRRIAPAPKLTSDQVMRLSVTHQGQVQEKELKELSNRLCVHIHSLRQLGIGWDGSTWTFPMFDGDGSPIGLHRRYPDGRKLCLRGSRLGLFIPFVTGGGNGNTSPPDAGNGAFVTTEGPKQGLVLPPRTLLICEGASDTAAALTLEYDAIGLPSAGQSIDLVLAWVKRVRPGRIVIVADLDEGSSTSNGRMTWPGIEGGLALAERLMALPGEVHFCLPPPSAKDLRQWIAGSAWEGIRAAIEASPKVNVRWMNQARQNVLANRRSRSDLNWARRAAGLLAEIQDDVLRADLRERFEERAALVEHEANLPRDEAERLAFEALSQAAEDFLKRGML